MSTFAKLRSTSETAKRRMRIAFAAIWVCLAIQPCAMAAASETDCPHCPPEIEQAMHAGHQHAEHMHDGSAGTAADAECCEVGSAIVNPRSDKLDPNDVGDYLALPPGLAPVALLRREPCARRTADPPERARSPVPLHILYCVYRD